MTPMYVTLNDLEWLERPFYVKFSPLRTEFESYYLLIYLFTYLLYSLLYTHVTSGDVRKRSRGL